VSMSDDWKWWQLQAGEYVLGTLERDEQRRFEALLQHDEALQSLVHEWQQRLQPLADTAQAVEPPARVWQQIHQQLQDDPVTQLPVATTHGQDQTLWRGVASLAMAACLIMSLLLWQRPIPQFRADQQALGILADDNQTVLWLVDASLDDGTLRITAVAPPDLDAAQSWQLWLVEPGSAGVTSLGLLPLGSNETIQVKSTSLRRDSAAFAVSLEPLGGSPEPVPTGPVLYQGEFRLLRPGSI